MIVPRVMLLGSIEVASRWLGVAKKWAREMYENRQASASRKVATGVTLHVENLFSSAGAMGGVSKVRIEADIFQPSFLIVCEAYYTAGGTSALINATLFTRVKQPFDQDYIPESAPPYYGPPYGPYNVENWKYSNVFGAGGFGCDGFLTDEPVGGPPCVNSDGYRLVGLSFKEPGTSVDDMYRHYKIIFSKTDPTLQYLYETPYWNDEYLISGSGWSAFATSDKYLYEIVSTGNNDLDKRGWWNVRNLATGELLLDHIALPYTDTAGGIAAIGDYVFLCGRDLYPDELTILKLYEVTEVDGEVIATQLWSVTLDWQVYYVDAVALNKDCAYIIHDTSYWNEEHTIKYYEATIEARDIRFGNLVGSLVLPYDSGIPGDETVALYSWYEGIAVNKTRIMTIQADNRVVKIYKRIPVYDETRVVISESYEHEYTLKMGALPIGFDFAPMSVIGH